MEPKTVKETISVLDQIEREYNRVVKTDDDNNKLDAINMATIALELQLPKKPRRKTGKHPFDGCPNCEHAVSPVQSYCEACGQRIDWGS